MAQSNYRRDLTGLVFGHLTVIGLDTKTMDKQRRWLCKCDCGNPKTRSIVGKSLTRTNGVQSCGKCASYQLIGQKIGRWIVLDIDKESKEPRGRLLCKYDCGNPQIISVLGNTLRNGESKSCGKCNQFTMIGKVFGRLTVLEVDLDKNLLINIPFINVNVHAAIQ